MMAETYTVYKIDAREVLSHKEVLNNIDELNAWIEKVRGKFARIYMVKDSTGKGLLGMDTGEGDYDFQEFKVNGQ